MSICIEPERFGVEEHRMSRPWVERLRQAPVSAPRCQDDDDLDDFDDDDFDDEFDDDFEDEFEEDFEDEDLDDEDEDLDDEDDDFDEDDDESESDVL